MPVCVLGAGAGAGVVWWVVGCEEEASVTTAGSTLMCLIPAPSLRFPPTLGEIGVFFV